MRAPPPPANVPPVGTSTDRGDGERRSREHGWELGAGGLTRASWGTLAALLAGLAILLLASGYMGYGAIIMILAAAAAVNLF